jgi:hypothetical protein
MSKPRDSVIWGVILLVIGAGILLWNLDILGSAEAAATWATVALFALLGLAFIFGYLNQRAAWWRLIPGFTLLAVAAIIFLSARGLPASWVAAVLLASITLAFLVIYLSDRGERWWALIPAGSVAVMVVVVLLSTRPAMNPELLGAVLFGGMALVFYLIYLLAAERQRFAWTLAPAAALGVMGLAALAAHLAGSSPALATVQRLWPTLLIVAGAALLGYAGLRASRQTPPAVAPPAAPAAAVPPLASGASVTTVTDDAPPAKKPRYERSPITLVDEKPASQASGGVPGGEVPDIYEFLKNAPPEEGSQR